ncbi:4-hydroxy-3-methylbut-2-enyl diphosphate reductase [Actinoplanes derwentensis]|uniref:4-hydroxy-3-methylbut-2-enyl diphosphate reductase n=1 Tax=Actinoplanes derwentensis TaxID=113562 RepID=A0A1H2DEF2_9ACTN|nr:4-hydroxy-3-methylbut-2-enyl diphosphate reductase [Actinoplanes derwentensis]GID84774.1 4-hydroxy-3-methylbut-2-enyl diphosphate reductase 2 [Actinoplanes derwentensis]SDT81125.1 4-hydroxy-3-methylbut-2-enyl diphosphate reductase [Actinoplanes derwentensis]
MEVLLAAPRSFCAGVERAVDMVDRALQQHGPPVYVRRQIVHNAHVVAGLEARGVIFVDELDTVPDGAVVVFSAHGVAPAVRADAARRELDVIDATCPLVAKVHTEARRFAARGDTVLLIGHAGHDEIEGTLGQAPGIQLIPDVAAARSVRAEGRVSYITQTTLAADETGEIIDALTARFPEISGPDDICYATTNRQAAVVAIAAACDLVLVVGSANSSNSLRLTEVARRHGTPAHLIEDASGIRPEWLDGVRTVGLTAGASAPPHLVDEVIAVLAPARVTEHRVAEENITFLLPPALREAQPATPREAAARGSAEGRR